MIDKILRYKSAYYGDPTLRAALNEFAATAFPGLDFRPWNALGVDDVPYTPFSFFVGDKVVANISASPMNLVIAGQEKACVQVGTVASHKDFRGRGLIRELITRAHNHWESSRPHFFLFANENSVTLYPKFGYRRVPNWSFSVKAPKFSPPTSGARSLDLHNPSDLALLRRSAEKRLPISNTLGVHKQSWLTLFYAATFFPNCLRYIESLDAIVIAKFDAETIYLKDVIADHRVSIDEIYPFIGSDRVAEIRFGFTPDLLDVENAVASANAESLFLVRDPFPEIMAPFTFPHTEQA